MVEETEREKRRERQMSNVFGLEIGLKCNK